MAGGMDRWRGFDRNLISLGYAADWRGRAASDREGFSARLRDGTAWRSFAEVIAQLAPIIAASGLGRTDAELAEGQRYLMGLVTARLNGLLYAGSPSRPVFVRAMDDILKFGMDNADGMNSNLAHIDGRHDYRITGRLGGERYIEFVQAGRNGTLANHYLDDFAVAADGAFEIALTADPVGGNHIPLHPAADSLMVRQIFYDWEAPPGSVHIEVSGQPDAAYPCLTVPDPAETAAMLDQIADALADEVRFWIDYTKAFAEIGANMIAADQPLASSGKSAVRAAPKGLFKIAPDEALIATFADPGGSFWSVGLSNMWFNSIAPFVHHSHINGGQARLDPDGLYRVVIAHHDPGYANWLDTAGHERGFMIFRFVRTDLRPLINLKLVKLDQLGSAMPDGAPTMTARERANILRRRMRGANQRFSAPMTSRWKSI